jgi:hypothetical protein
MGATLPFLLAGAFEPNDIRAMSLAYEDICATLHINGDSMARDTIAVRVIELARLGECSPTLLRERVLREAGHGQLCCGQGIAVGASVDISRCPQPVLGKQERMTPVLIDMPRSSKETGIRSRVRSWCPIENQCPFPSSLVNPGSRPSHADESGSTLAGGRRFPAPASPDLSVTDNAQRSWYSRCKAVSPRRSV